MWGQEDCPLKQRIDFHDWKDSVVTSCPAASFWSFALGFALGCAKTTSVPPLMKPPFWPKATLARGTLRRWGAMDDSKKPTSREILQEIPTSSGISKNVL